jgi:hypothetical protein
MSFGIQREYVLINVLHMRYTHVVTYTNHHYIVVNIIRKWMCAKNLLLFYKKRLSYIKDGDLL